MLRQRSGRTPRIVDSLREAVRTLIQRKGIDLLTFEDQHDEAVSLCDKLATCVHVGLGEQWCDHDTLVSLMGLTRTVLSKRRARRSPCSPWNDGVIVTYEQVLAKASSLRAITAFRIHARSRPLPVFLSTLSAAAIVFLVAAHGTSEAVMFV